MNSLTDFLQIKLNYPESYLQIHLYDQFPIKNWIFMNAAAKKSKQCRPVHKEEYNKRINEAGEQAVKIFERHIKEAACEIGKHLRDVCNPTDFQLEMQSMLMMFFEKRVERYLVNNPEEREFEKKWEEFRRIFAQLRFKNDPKLFSKVQEYLDYLKSEFRKIDFKAPRKELDLETRIWKIFRYILNKNLSLLDVPVAVLAGVSPFDNVPLLNTCAPFVLEANNHILKRMIGNLSVVFDTFEEKLTPFLLLPQDETMNPAQLTLDTIRNFKILLSPLLPKLLLSDLLGCSKDKMIICQKALLLNNQLYNPYKDISIGYIVEGDTAFTVLNNISVNFSYTNAPTTLLSQHYQELLKRKKELEGGAKRREEDQLDLLANEKNIERVKLAIEFYEALNECCIILNTYLQMPLSYLSGSYLELNKWYLNLHQKIRNKLKNPVICTPTVANIKKVSSEKLTGNTKANKKKNKPFQGIQQSEKLKESQKQKPRLQKESTHQKKAEVQKESPVQKESAKMKAPTKPETPSKMKGETESGQEKVLSENKPAPKAKTQALPVQLSQILAEEAASTLDPQLKPLLRQAHMHLEDMNIAIEGYHQAKTDASKLFYLMTLVQSSYFNTEQLLHYHRACDPGLSGDVVASGHNLLRLLQGTKLASLSSHEVPSQLFLANYWTRSPEDQLQKREAWDIPSYLFAIKQIYDAKNFSDPKLKSTVNKVKSVYAKTIDFCHRLPLVKEMIKNFVDKEIKPVVWQSFHPGIKIEAGLLEETVLKCTEVFQFVSPIWHSKLSQALSHLKLIKGILDELNKEQISSNKFSLLVRSLLFWENTLIEELLQTLYGKKTGIDTYSHELGSLYQNIFSEDPTEKNHKDLEFLQQNMANLHNICRYPFVHQGSEFSHMMILQAELLREHPELGIEAPFELPQNRTQLNYLDVSKREIAPGEIGEKLKAVHHKIFKIISKRILPKFEVAY